MKIIHKAPGTPGSNIVNNPLEIKTVRAGGFVPSENSETVSPKESSTEVQGSTESQAPLTDAERRQQRKAEYREAASIRERALRMQKEAEDKIKQTQQFAQLMQRAKEDPTVLAQALNMDQGEFQRKMFNKMYNIKDEPQKPETFEEQTKRRLEQYEQELSRNKEYQAEQTKIHVEQTKQQIKNTFVRDNILPCINESHEFIHRNDKQSCAYLVYDLMNQAFQEHCEKGGSEANFSLKAEDVVNQMEEELQKRAEEQLQEARSIGKLKKYFGEEDEGYSIRKKDFSSRRDASPTLSRSIGVSAPPSLTSSLPSSSVSSKKIPLKDKNARLMRLQRVLGQD